MTSIAQIRSLGRALILGAALIALTATALVAYSLSATAAANEQIARAESLMLMAPVLNRPVARNAVIREDDLRWVEVNAERLPRQAILEADRIVGMAAKRSLRAGQPIRVRDVAEPLAIEKGETVAIVFKTANMMLTARGRALEGAAVGHSVRVLNAHSKRTIEATAVAHGIVSASPFSHADIAKAMK